MTTTIKLFMVGLMSMAALSLSAQAKKKADKDTDRFRYEIQCVGTGVQGTYLIKVFTFSKKPQVAKEQSKKNAVHGVIFKGFAGGNGCQSQKPLSRNPNLMEEKADFFESFFETKTGMYRKYVNMTTDGAVGAGDVSKVNKKEYKVGVVVSVNKDELRKYLEAEGILKGLASGF